MIRTTTRALCILCLCSSAALAGGKSEPRMEPEILAAETAASSGSGNGVLLATVFLSVLTTIVDN